MSIKKAYGILLISTGVGLLLTGILTLFDVISIQEHYKLLNVGYLVGIAGLSLMIIDLKIRRRIKSDVPAWIKLALVLITCMLFVVSALSKNTILLLSAVIYLECIILIAF